MTCKNTETEVGKTLELSIVIPAHNEEQRLEKSLKILKEYLNAASWSHEIIVVDDGSTDLSPKIVEHLKAQWNLLRLLRYDICRGKGFAQRYGMDAAQGKFVICIDADLPVPLIHLEEMMTGLKEGYDAILASRHTEGSKINRPQSFIRTLLGGTYRITVRTVFLKNIRDPNCGFKGFRSSQIKKILPYLTIDRYVCDVELIYLLQCHQMTIKEHGVQWNHRPHSKVLPFRDSLFSSLELLKLSFRILRGDYKV